MKKIVLFKMFCSFVFLLTSSFSQAIDIDQQGFSAADGFQLTTSEDGLGISWQAPEGEAFMELQFVPRSGNRAAAPLIRQIGVNGVPALEGVDPNYLFWVGDRDLETRDGWTIFFDRVPTRPYSVEKGYLVPTEVKVTSNGGRASIEIEGLSSTHFSGSLAFVLYHDSPFVHMEARVSTDRPATAFLYHVGLGKADTVNHSIEWVDSLGNPNSSEIEKRTAQVYETRYRSMAVSSQTGSVVISPFPHQFLYPLDFAENFGYNWAGNEYLDMIDGFAWGVRQPPIGDRRFVPWVNAQPGSAQKLGVLLFVSSESGLENLATVERYTRNDTFKPLPGYKTLTSHYHHEHSLEIIRSREELGISGVPNELEDPEFVQFFKRMGIDIVHMAEFHNGRTPVMDTMERLSQLDVMHQEFSRLSGEGFLLLPGEEPNVHLGGHWLSLFPEPVNWVLNQGSGQPFVQEMDGYGKVYHVGSAEDVHNLLQLENGLAWTAHARVKGSTGFPDAYKDTDFFQSKHFLGAAWKAMPADYSRDTLGWRVIDLLDDMANWNPNNPKYVLGEVDIFRIHEDYELFGTMNINYLKLDAVPEYENGWQPVMDALQQGRFFVSTGEVLIPDFDIGGRESGETITGINTAALILNASLEWTYPMSHLEIVTGDGDKIYRERIDLSASREFGSTKIQYSLDLSNRNWVRIEAWDIAKNGAFTQPVWIEN